MNRSLMAIALMGLVTSSQANDLVIESFSENGQIAWTDVYTNGHYRVEWVPHISQQWRWTWDNMLQVPATGGLINVDVPMFYRVVHFPPVVFADSAELLLVSGGGQFGGPTHDFYMGKYEVTEIEYLTFLNDAQANPSNERGANMYFDANGDIYMDTNKTSTELLFDISNSKLIYNVNLAPSSRYSCFPDRTNHPITGVSWYGAVKYCNWLTIHSGRGIAERCFTEGAAPTNWHPANVTYSQWADGYDSSERIDLINNFSGFRLPMDDYATGPSYFNEFYKAAAWKGTSNVLYGFGRSTLTTSGANYYNSADPYEGLPIATTPVGFYDGSNHGGLFSTLPNNNYYGIYDLCGNVFELQLDFGNSGGDATYAITRGGAWVMSSGSELYARHRDTYVRSAGGGGSGPLRKHQTSHNIGFRIVTIDP